MSKELKVEAVRGVLRQFIADDGLKPEWDGMTTWEIATKILQAIDNVDANRKLTVHQERSGRGFDPSPNRDRA